MKLARWIFWLLFVLVVLGLPGLFVLQNLERTTDLSINLYFFQRHLAEPVSVPLLLLGTFAAGGLLGFLAAALLRWRRRAASHGTGLDDAWA